jgi:hypothetical protein
MHGRYDFWICPKEANMTELANPNMGLEFDRMLFRTPIARCRYIGTAMARRPQWLKDHPGDWTGLVNTPQTNSCQPASCVSKRSPSSPPPSSTLQKDSEAAVTPLSMEESSESASSVEILSTSGDPPIDPDLSAKAELQIADRAYVSAACLAGILGISERTLSRWCADGKGPPHLRIQGNYFEKNKISAWAASRGVNLK